MKLILLALFTLNLQAKETFKVLHVNDLESMLKSNPGSVQIYDCNVDSTRIHVGTIPGAKLLESSSDYNVEENLPKDKDRNLVFYCANTMCTASHTAAERAIAHHYTHVSVMVDGIYGWQKAGKTLAPAAWPTVPVDPKTAFDLVNKKTAIIVDVRENEERHEVIKDSLSMPMSKINDSTEWQNFVKTLPHDKTIIFHCAAGVRSERVAKKLSSTGGYKTAFFKGPDQWKQQGLSTVPGPAK